MEKLGQLLVEQLVCHIGPVLVQRAVEGGPPRVNRGNNICRFIQRSHQVVQRVHFIGQVQVSKVDFDPGKGRSNHKDERQMEWMEKSVLDKIFGIGG